MALSERVKNMRKRVVTVSLNLETLLPCRQTGNTNKNAGLCSV